MHFNTLSYLVVPFHIHKNSSDTLPVVAVGIESVVVAAAVAVVDQNHCCCFEDSADVVEPIGNSNSPKKQKYQVLLLYYEAIPNALKSILIKKTSFKLPIFTPKCYKA